jgi:DNA-binding FrmR family transcriptional regulator
MLSAEEKVAVEKRLARIAGQVAGIQRMVDEDRYCIDIVMQVSAARSALAKVAEAVLAQHFETCLVDTFESGTPRDRRQKVQELMKVFARHGNV